jgi:hypothetical protein
MQQRRLVTRDRPANALKSISLFLRGVDGTARKTVARNFGPAKAHPAQVDGFAANIDFAARADPRVRLSHGAGCCGSAGFRAGRNRG